VAQVMPAVAAIVALVPTVIAAIVVPIPTVVATLVPAMIVLVMLALDVPVEPVVVGFPVKRPDEAHHWLVMPVRPVPVTAQLVTADHVAHHRTGDERQRFVVGIGAGGERCCGQGHRDGTGAQHSDGFAFHVLAPDDDGQGQVRVRRLNPP
jgi:hypothetical protein